MKSVPHSALIVSMDVKTLYSSIPQSNGIIALETFLIENGFPTMEISNITKIIDFILTHNYLEISDQSYMERQWKQKWPQHLQTFLCGTLKDVCWINAQTNHLYIYICIVFFS